MYSIYHFFAHLIQNRSAFSQLEPLETFPFPLEMLSCKNRGKFPDLAIRLSPESQSLTGGELIELKDSQSYTISSFNSTIPTGKKAINQITSGSQNSIRAQMEQAGDDIFSLPIRDVFYLVRGRKKVNVKVCLVHGSFFETIKAEELIQQAFSQVLEERLTGENFELSHEVKAALVKIFSNQESFSKVRDIAQASVKLRFRIMTEAKKQGNILNSEQYPQIGANTLNFVLPCHSDEEEEAIREKLSLSMNPQPYSELEIFKITHHLNGDFLAFQTEIV